MAKPFSRKGLHRLECDACPAYVYATVACLESRGLPVCSCGGAFQPERLELAMALGMDDHPAVRAFEQRAAVKLAERAFDEIRAEQREMARKRRLAALRPAPEAIL